MDRVSKPLAGTLPRPFDFCDWNFECFGYQIIHAVVDHDSKPCFIRIADKTGGFLQ
jgi:hypothetical protein